MYEMRISMEVSEIKELVQDIHKCLFPEKRNRQETDIMEDEFFQE
jgi:hypothetical protein